MPRTTIARTCADLESLRGLWGSLYRPENQTLFQSFDWNLLAARVFAGRNALNVVAVEEIDGAAIIPACVSGEGVRLLGEELFDYRDTLSGGAGSALTAAWKSLADARLPLHVTALLGDEARERWGDMGFLAEPFVTAPHVLRGDTDAAAFEAHHHRSARLLRRLTRAGASVKVHPGTNSALVREIYERKAQQSLPSGENLFTDAARRNFLIAAAALGNSCDVFTVESAGTLVAALVTFRDERIRRFYTVYYDHDWAHYSPGVALLFEATRRSLAEGLDCDYMTGEQPHKMRLASSAVPLYRVNASAERMAEVGAGASMAAA